MVPDENNKKISRRRFFDILASLGGLATIIMVVYPLLGFLRPPRRSSEATSFVEVGNVDDIPPDQGKDVTAPNGEPVIVINRGEQEGLIALSKRCTHLGCIVQLKGNELFCPCHGARFNLEGKVIAGPAPRPLPKYMLKVLGGKLQLGGPLEGM